VIETRGSREENSLKKNSKPLKGARRAQMEKREGKWVAIRIGKAPQKKKSGRKHKSGRDPPIAETGKAVMEG